jgi:alpha-L-rhamnosidase
VYDELSPGFTDFRQRVYTDLYDLKPYLKEENVLVAVVAPGWWSGRVSFGAFGREPLCFAAVVTLTMPDGHVETVQTDGTWECAVCGPTLTSDIYDGERTDARMPHPSEPCTPYAWAPVALYDYRGKVEPRLGPPVRLRPDLTRQPQSAVLWRGTVDDGSDFGAICVKMKRVGRGCESVTLRPGEHLILDMGQNMVGRPRITLQAKPGVELHFLYAEMLNDSGARARGCDGPAGSLYVANYRSARAIGEYITSGASGESYAPHFTFYGFRYVELTASETVEILSVRGEVLTSATKEVSEIETDDARLNRLISNIEWGRRSNYLHVPTDCPQRDERLGWTGDTHIFCGAAAYLCDIRSFMRKWLCDARDSQLVLDGAYADVIPHVLDNGFAGSAGWGDAAIIIPRYLRLMYGDTDILREHYASMETYMAYLARFGFDGGRTAYGDWLAYEETDRRYIAMCYYAYDATLMEQYSRILSDTADDFYDRRARHYHTLGEEIRTAFCERYVRDGVITETSQTAYLLALKFRMVEGAAFEHAAEQLYRKIEDNDYTLSTGFIGTGILAQTLSELGRDDLVYSLLLQTRDPSWLYSVEQGATTVWERWNSYTKERGFGDVSMNSFNHYAYGAVLEWLFASAAGIRPDEEAPGFAHLILAPHPDTRSGSALPAGEKPLTAIRAHYDSIRGRVESAWNYEGDEFVWSCTVPEGITATIRFPMLQNRVPTDTRETIRINGVPYTVAELCGVQRDTVWEFELPAGSYEIR